MNKDSLDLTKKICSLLAERRLHLLFMVPGHRLGSYLLLQRRGKLEKLRSIIIIVSV